MSSVGSRELECGRRVTRKIRGGVEQKACRDPWHAFWPYPRQARTPRTKSIPMSRCLWSAPSATTKLGKIHISLIYFNIEFNIIIS